MKMSKMKDYVINKMNQSCDYPYFPDIIVDLRRYRENSSEITTEVTKAMRRCKVSEYMIKKYQKDASNNRSCDAKLVAAKWISIKQ